MYYQAQKLETGNKQKVLQVWNNILKPIWL